MSTLTTSRCRQPGALDARCWRATGCLKHLRSLSITPVVARAARLVLILAGMLMSASGFAHSLGQTYLYLSFTETQLTARFEVTASDLNAALGLDLATDGSLTTAQVEPYQERIADYLRSKVTLAPGGEPARLETASTTLRSPKLAQYILSEFTVALPGGPPEYIDVAYGVMFEVDPKQQGLVLIENSWRAGTFANEASVALTFAGDASTQRLDLSGSTLLSGMWSMALLGMHHIIEGIDHVMFLFALLLTSVVQRENGRWRGVADFRSAAWNVLKVVTVFTVAHSITLSLTTLETLAIDSRIVESVIAASIAIAALEVFVPIFRSRLTLVVFAFGLFHGAGFAGILLDMNIHGDYLPLTLLGFNLGVELGQVSVVSALLVCLCIVPRRGVRPLALTLSYAAGALALFWMVQRVRGV